MKNLPLLLIVFCLFSCGSKKNNKKKIAADKPVVSVVNYPLCYFTERIGGDFVELNFPIDQGTDPAYWVPTSESLSSFQKSDVIFTNGANYARWLNNVSLPERLVVNTSATIADKLIEVQEGVSHSHGADGEHVHTGFAFTTWLNFEIAVEQARTIQVELIKLLPEKESTLKENFKLLEKELLALHRQLLNNESEMMIIGSHPVYQYLSSAYHLHIHSVHFEPDVMPTSKQWHNLDHLLDHHPSSVMIWENEPGDDIRVELQKRNIKVVVFNPCANKPSQGDFMSVMNLNIKSLIDVLS